MKLQAAGLGCLLGRRRVLEGLDIEVGRGEVLAVLGANGAGKSTLLRVLAGLLPVAAGSVLWDGSEPSAPARRQLGYLGHQTALYENLSALENLLFYAELFGVPGAERRAKRLLAAEGLTLFTHEPVRHFSRGMQQRLALARVWLPEPRTVLLDEPWTALDAASVARWEARVRALRAAGGAAIVALHDLEAAARLADRYVRLKGGRLAGAGTYASGVGAGADAAADAAAGAVAGAGTAELGPGVPRRPEGVAL